jgi:hypothetical protein
MGREEGFGILRAIGFGLVFLAVVISETKLSFLRKRKNNKTSVKGDLP